MDRRWNVSKSPQNLENHHFEIDLKVVLDLRRASRDLWEGRFQAFLAQCDQNEKVTRQISLKLFHFENF